MSNVDFGIRVNLEGGQQAVQQSDQLARNFGALEGVAQRFGAALGAVVGTVATRAFVQMADSVTVLRNQLTLATGSIQQAEVAYGALFQIAQRSRQSFADLGATFASISRATGELGISQSRLLTVTEAIGNAIAISGGSAAGAQAALVQLSQGFAAGALRGEELNSVMEQTPRLAKAIADGLGITIGQLRTMGQEGKLTAQAVLGALESQARVLSGEVASSVTTVAQSAQVARNALTALVGEIDRVTGSSGSMAGVIIAASEALGDITEALRDVEVAGQSVSTVGAAFSVVFETITVLGANVAYVLQGIGRELGGLAAQAVAIASGEFAQAAAIRQAMVADAEKARADVDALTNRILQARQLRELAQQSLQGVDTRAEDSRLARQGRQQRVMAQDVKATAAELRSASQEAEKQRKVLNDIVGVTDDFTESARRLQAMRQRNAISEEQYAAALARLAQRQPAVIEAERRRMQQAQEYLGMQQLREEGELEIAEAEAASAKARQDAVEQVRKQVDAARDEAAAAELVASGVLTHAQAIQRVTLARLEDQRQRLVNDPAELAALEQRIALQRKLIGLADEKAGGEEENRRAQEAGEKWKEVADGLRGALTDAFRRSFESGESFGRAFGQVIEREIKARIASAIAGQLTEAAFSAGKFLLNLALTPSANGNAFDHAGLVPFAAGGIVDSPTVFGFGGGRAGLMGEAGPEAILPLKRGPDGRLGVQSSGGVVINQTINVAAGASRNEVLQAAAAAKAAAVAEIQDLMRRGSMGLRGA